MIDQTDQLGVFKIGHDASKSQTFLPEFAKLQLDQDHSFLFTDIAGVQDTSGNLVDFINCMVDKYIFMKAKSVRFIAPISYSSLTGSRGMNVREIYEYHMDKI